MTISGILSGVADPLGMGFVLSRAAARAQPINPAERVPGPGPDNAAAGSDPELPLDLQLFDVEDTVELSDAAERAAQRSTAVEAASSQAGARELTPENQARIEELKQRDAEVRQHEQAHLAAAGPYALGGASFEYETGPDGKRYAVGGEVQIDLTPIPDDPEATIRKMEQVRAAALAPATPSAADQRVAARASALMNEARAELAQASNHGATDATAAGSRPDEGAEPAAPGNYSQAAAAVAAFPANTDDAAQSRPDSRPNPNARSQSAYAEPGPTFDTYA